VVLVTPQAEEDDHRRHERPGDGERRDPPGGGLAETATGHQQHEEPGEGQGRDHPGEIEHRSASALQQ
jgi:hypothetical protein